MLFSVLFKIVVHYHVRLRACFYLFVLLFVSKNVGAYVSFFNMLDSPIYNTNMFKTFPYFSYVSKRHSVINKGYDAR